MVTIPGEHRDYATAWTITPLSESAAALAVIVLAILGLVNIVPEIMVAVATIVVGAAILLQGAQTVGEYSHLVATGNTALTQSNWGGGVTLEFLAGGAGIVLGILALFSHTPTLAPAALIVFGATLLLYGTVAARQTATGVPAGDTASAHVAEAIAAQMTGVASGAQIMVGIAAVVLGILALIPIHDTVLTLIGLLAIGAAVLMTAVASGGLVMSALRR